MVQTSAPYLVVVVMIYTAVNQKVIFTWSELRGDTGSVVRGAPAVESPDGTGSPHGLSSLRRNTQTY